MKQLGICLLIHDVPRLARFYELILQAPGSGDAAYTQFSVPCSCLELWNRGDAATQPNGNLLINWDIGDADREHERLKQLGLPLLSPPKNLPWGLRSLETADPDGNRVVIWQRLGGESACG